MTSQTWRIETRHFLTQKEDCAPAECEDAIGINAESWRYAVADGATEGFDSRRWARRLVDGWTEADPAPLSAEAFGAWVEEQGRWLHASWNDRPLPWYAEAKARQGSYAAFVGLQFRARGAALQWQAIALGDSCMIQRRGGSVSRALPISDDSLFNSSPVLVPSLTSLHETALSHLTVDEGMAERGDVFFLLSDAGAAWYLKLWKERKGVEEEFDSLLAASDGEALLELFRRERQAKKINNDDIAILRIAIEEARPLSYNE
ncbi:MAG TPA: hypothetical protein VF527_21670 [Pyrinomonadaceae bacterium]|jgi:hypothetical protein